MSLCILILPIITNYWFISAFSLLLIRFIRRTLLYTPILNSTHVFNFLELDTIRSSLIILTFWVSSLIILSRQIFLILKKSPQSFRFIVIILIFILIITFSVNNLLQFYILFESSLIPTLLLVLGWGYQPERIQAGIYLILYTITASLPLLIRIVYIYYLSHHLYWFYPFWLTPTLTNRIIQLWWFASIIAFITKIPLYLTHLWLPKAHVEAPVAGSIILAAILLKLGGYGLLRIISVFQYINYILSPIIIALSLWGAVITSLICMRQRDIKSLIAYSSVGHIGLLIRGAISCSLWGYQGALIIIIAHGLCSSGIFAIANITYEATHTRRLFLTKGLIRLFPTITLLWFIYTCANIAAPPSINLLREIILITSSTYISLLLIFPIRLIRFLGASYSLILFTSTQHGSTSNSINPNNYIKLRNIRIRLLHILPIFLLIITPNLII